MRVVIVALACAAAVAAALGWLGRDAERAALGASTTVELAMAGGAPTRAADPDSGSAAEFAPREPSAGASRRSAGASAVAPDPEIPEAWVASEREFAEGEVDERHSASIVDPPETADVENDIPGDTTSPIAGVVDHDAWRDRIRRMLDVYRRVGALQ